jgi:hypothetical protein
VKPAEQRTLAAIEADLSRLIRYDDESIVAAKWIRQRYDCGCYPGLAAARQAVVRTAWHEAGHAAAALAVGANFSSASIHHGCASEGRVHAITAGAGHDYVIHAGGQVAERLMNWTMLERDGDLRAWLSAWTGDGGDARHFRRALRGRPDADEFRAWRRSEEILTPMRLKIRQVARALLVHHRHLPYNVVAAIAAGPAGQGAGRMAATGSAGATAAGQSESSRSPSARRPPS